MALTGDSAAAASEAAEGNPVSTAATAEGADVSPSELVAVKQEELEEEDSAEGNGNGTRDAGIGVQASQTPDVFPRAHTFVASHQLTLTQRACCKHSVKQSCKVA